MQFQVPQLTGRERVIAAYAAAAGTAVGASATFLVLRKQIKETVDQMEQLLGFINEIAEDDAKSDPTQEPDTEYFTDALERARAKTMDAVDGERVFGEKPDLDELAAELGYTNGDNQTIFEAGYTPAEQAAIDEIIAEEDAQEPEYEGVVPGNVFENEPDPDEVINPDYTPEWDYVKEIATRASKTGPYVIHVDEFRQNENGWVQTTLTWYEGDEVLADDRDVPVDAIDTVVGLENLQTKFGHGSGNADVVFIRNESMQLEVEIQRSEGKFAHEVLGSELKHSDEPRSRGRRRFDDE